MIIRIFTKRDKLPSYSDLDIILINESLAAWIMRFWTVPCLSSPPVCFKFKYISSQLGDEDGNSKNNQPIISSLFRMDCVNFIFLWQQKLLKYLRQIENKPLCNHSHWNSSLDDQYWSILLVINKNPAGCAGYNHRVRLQLNVCQLYWEPVGQEAGGS